MKNLLSAEFLRLFKSKLFYILTSLSFVFGIVLQVYIYIGSKVSEIEPRIEYGFFAVAAVVGFVVAVFVSLFVGTEYSDGTLRNKIVHGKKRISIYFSKLITCCLAMLLMYAAYYISSLIFGYILCGKFTTKASSVIITALVLYLCTCAYICLFLMISMNCSKKAVVSVVSLIMTMALFFTAVAVSTALSEPEYFPEAIYMDTETGQLVKEPEMPNPHYISGTKRKIYEFVNDANPTGQCVQLSGAISDEGTVCKAEFPLYSTAIIAVSTVFGMALFRKKDIV